MLKGALSQGFHCVQINSVLKFIALYPYVYTKCSCRIMKKILNEIFKERANHDSFFGIFSRQLENLEKKKAYYSGTLI